MVLHFTLDKKSIKSKRRKRKTFWEIKNKGYYWNEDLKRWDNKMLEDYDYSLTRSLKISKKASNCFKILPVGTVLIRYHYRNNSWRIRKFVKK